MTPAIFGFSGLTLTDDERDFFRDADPAGYILFARNVESRAQMRALTDDLRAIHGRSGVLISIDQEGGRVARMRPPEWGKYPAGEAFAKLWNVAPMSAIEAARVNAEALGLDLAEAGITVDYWPVLDVRRPYSHDVVGDRALGSEPMEIAALGRAILDGLARAGVTGCIKHMPGHGRARVDSHKEMPVIEASEAELETDIEPFRTLADAPIGMTAHVVYTAWDADNPATQSEFVVNEIIRTRIGFTGLLLSDDVYMGALTGTLPERGTRALAAGCDVVLNCHGEVADMAAVADALPVMPSGARERLDAALSATGRSETAGDHAALIAKRDALLELARDPA
ncbi:MAG TPA: beta-N-acetylhexosaminidase [Croceibacterium sp.]|jgi:beta-N-acetylhexosaminidase